MSNDAAPLPVQGLYLGLFSLALVLISMLAH